MSKSKKPLKQLPPDEKVALLLWQGLFTYKPIYGATKTSAIANAKKALKQSQEKAKASGDGLAIAIATTPITRYAFMIDGKVDGPHEGSPF